MSISEKNAKQLQRLQNRLQDVERKLEEVRYQFDSPYVSSSEKGKLIRKESEYSEQKEKIENEMRKIAPAYQANYGGVGGGASHSLPYGSGTDVVYEQHPPQTQSYGIMNTFRSLNPFGSAKPSAEDLRWKQQEAEMERRREERRRNVAAETAATAAMIERTTIDSHARTLESLSHIDAEYNRRMAEEQRKEAERVANQQREDQWIRTGVLEEQLKYDLRDEEIRKEHERRNLERALELSRQESEARKETERLMAARQSQLNEDESRMRWNAEQQRKEIRETSEKYAREREAAEEELRKMDEEIRRVGEESRRKYENMRRQAQEQFDLLMDMVKRAEWSRAIESNWTIRLNALKSLIRRIEAAVRLLNEQLALAKVYDRDPKFISTTMEQLRSELAEVKRIMDREVENLDSMHTQTGKQFVSDIAHSLHTVSIECGRFDEFLSSHRASNKTETCNVYDGVEEHADAIYKAFKAIPTMESLKRKHNEGVPTSFGAIEDGNADGHVIQIVEID